MVELIQTDAAECRMVVTRGWRVGEMETEMLIKEYHPSV